MMKRSLVLLFLMMNATISLATVITPGMVVGAGGTGSVSALNTSTDPPTFRVNKAFTSLDPIDITFTVASSSTNPSGGFGFIEQIENDTGSTWFDFHLELGTGTGNNFRVIDPAINLRFTTSTQPTECSVQNPSFSTTCAAEVTTLGNGGSANPPTRVLDHLASNLNNDGVETGHELILRFGIGVPSGVTEFTLRQIPTTDGQVLAPTIPEPGTLAIVSLGLGLLGLGSVRRGKVKGATH